MKYSILLSLLTACSLTARTGAPKPKKEVGKEDVSDAEKLRLRAQRDIAKYRLDGVEASTLTTKLILARLAHSGDLALGTGRVRMK